MGDIKVFYETEIEEEIRKEGKDVNCFGIRDMGNGNGKWALYVVDLNENKIVRYTTGGSVRDRFYDILVKIDPPRLIEGYQYKGKYVKQEFSITEKVHPFIKKCMESIFTLPKNRAESELIYRFSEEIARGGDIKLEKGDIDILIHIMTFSEDAALKEKVRRIIYSLNSNEFNKLLIAINSIPGSVKSFMLEESQRS